MPKTTLKVAGWKCRECGHEWKQRGAEPPKQCPSPTCRTVFWNKAKVRK